MKVSLCVATRGDHAQIIAFFRSMRGLRFAHPWELVLVHNAPSPPPTAEYNKLAGPVNTRVLHEPLPGKGRALNQAIDAAQGELLVFTDDDVEHAPDWIQRMADVAEANPWASVLGGRIVPRGPVPFWIRRSSNLQAILLCEHDLGFERKLYPKGLYPYGPSMAVPRRALEASGARWLENLGPGTNLPVGDEYGFLAQISTPSSNDRLYVGDAVVYHRIQPLYFSLAGAVRRSYYCGLGAGKVTAQFGQANETGVLTRTMNRLTGLRSGRELACVTARAAGFAIGRFRRATLMTARSGD